MPTRHVWHVPHVLIPLFILFVFSACQPIEDPWQGQRGQVGRAQTAPGLVLRPESDRFLDTFIMGLEPYQTGFYKVPKLVKKPQGLAAAQVRDLQLQLYTLNFEHTHGAVLRYLPPNTVLYVGAPEGAEAGPAGIEKEALVEYLRQRCGWDERDLAQRLHFFPTRHPLVWLQDAGEILGHDRQGRAVIRVDATGRPEYIANIRALVRAYPQRFQLLETQGGVPAEGGDQELVWLPDGSLGLMAGRNRAVEYVRDLREGIFEARAMTRELAEVARQGFSSAFYGLPVFFLPWEVLLNPELGSAELFHSDMVAVILRNERGHHAFVPEYRREAGDANDFKPLDPALMAACQAEYAAVARQLEGMGYEVRRLPFADHPARGPANVIKYFDRYTKRHTVMLAQYPYHFPLGDPQSPARRLDQALSELANAVAMLEELPGPQTLKDLEMQISRAWGAMLSAGNSSNPDFQAQAAVFREAGYEVIPVPIFPGGSGGLHCMALR